MQKTMNQSKETTREEIQKALKEYLNQGGQIQILPSSEVYVPHYVGAEKYQTFESVENLL